MDYKKVKQIILQRFNDIIENLALQLSLLDEIEESIDKGLIDLEYNLENIDCLKAIGEDSSAKILSAYLQKLGLNARYLNPKQAGIIVSNEPGNAHILPDSYKKFRPCVRRKELWLYLVSLVTQKKMN